jgi:hypothetical protein
MVSIVQVSNCNGEKMTRKAFLKEGTDLILLSFTHSGMSGMV